MNSMSSSELIVTSPWHVLPWPPAPRHAPLPGARGPASLPPRRARWDTGGLSSTEAAVT